MLEILVYILLLILSIAVLLKSVDLFIHSAGKVALYYNVSGYAVSFFLVAVATSLPEILVGINASLAQNNMLAFGNAIGSNIALFSLVISLPVLAGAKICTKGVIKSKDLYITLVLALVPVVLSLNGEIGRNDGVFLISLYTAYMTYSVLKHKNQVRNQEDLVQTSIVLISILFVISLIFILLSSNLLVTSAISLSKNTPLNIGFIGLTITAIGTSLPEIVYALKSAQKNNLEETLGNVLGSVVANSTLVIGATAIIFPIPTGHDSIAPSTYLFYILISMIFVKFSRTKSNINKLEATILLGIYLLFIATELYFSS